jgi:hypothetical protein
VAVAIIMGMASVAIPISATVRVVSRIGVIVASVTGVKSVLLTMLGICPIALLLTTAATLLIRLLSRDIILLAVTV